MRQRIYKFEAEHRSSEIPDSIELYHSTKDTRHFLDLRSVHDEELMAFFHDISLGTQIRVTFEVVESE